MPIALAELAAAIALFFLFVWLGGIASVLLVSTTAALAESMRARSAYRRWKRHEREARAHHRSGRFLDDRRPARDPGVTDAEWEEMRR
jgi:hypothetical protein